MISVKDLTVAFGDRAVLDGIDLEVPRGEVLALLGKNGSGKTVLLKAIAGLIPDYKGNVRVGGIEMREYHGDDVASSLGGEGPRIAYVFQKGGLFDSMNVYDNVAFGVRRAAELHDGEGAVTEALRRVGLAGNDDRLPSELSGGMRKRVGLARAICLNPEVILYDDPTAGLDPILSDSIADLMLEITGTYHSTSIVVTHDLRVAEKTAGRVALLYGGKIVFDGAATAFFSGEDPYARQFLEGDTEGPIDMY
ncbi:MAG TPA: ATP-binding cassette domain-containing protein [Spirochaetes bacterium]|nr:ATP-binding cassette domain-containing protein [Spirochaetota bacterium]